jgi:hypothetical protein
VARNGNGDNGDAGVSQVQQSADEANEKGYYGAETDPTPNSAYTVSGVTSGEGTPETDEDARAAADERADELARGENDQQQ